MTQLFKGAVMVFIGGCSYGILSTFVKLAYAAHFRLADVTGGQFLFGAICFWIVAAFSALMRRRPTRTDTRHTANVSTGAIGKLLAVGFLGGSTGILYYFSLRYLSAPTGILILFQFTWMGVFTEAIISRRVPKASRMTSALVILCGTVVATGVITHRVHDISWTGVGLAFLAAIAQSLFMTLSGTVALNINPWTRSAIMVTGSFVLALIVFNHAFFGVTFWLCFVRYGWILGLFGSFLPVILFTTGFPATGPGLGSILAASELPAAIIMSSIFLNESIGGVQWVGVILILAGIIIPGLLVQRRARTIN
ncbi:EamA family transporter [Alicyclobacillus sp. ALC3]|uniref:EamA family transporter n=1 Tax=Alicyclobacillus sp. ALC3 TaxID=2796143 RepID=UPI002378AA2E|nr:DMT family transporter [Alicyclobacillus sp. ALC3]WDL98432.1 DMT family transporter [Alicyclobacillus sp. ALC3]